MLVYVLSALYLGGISELLNSFDSGSNCLRLIQSLGTSYAVYKHLSLSENISYKKSVMLSFEGKEMITVVSH